MNRVLRRCAAVAIVVSAGTLAVGAHDFWLVPDATVVGRNADIVIRGQTSSAFPFSVTTMAVAP